MATAVYVRCAMCDEGGLFIVVEIYVHSDTPDGIKYMRYRSGYCVTKSIILLSDICKQHVAKYVIFKGAIVVRALKPTGIYHLIQNIPSNYSDSYIRRKRRT